MRSADRSGYVYFIHAKMTNRVKVGSTKSIESRLKALQTGSPYELELLVSLKVQDRLFIEKRFHSFLKAYNIGGEWFEFFMESRTGRIVPLRNPSMLAVYLYKLSIEIADAIDKKMNACRICGTPCGQHTSFCDEHRYTTDRGLPIERSFLRAFEDFSSNSAGSVIHVKTRRNK